MRSLPELSEREILALAIGAEEEDGRIYADFADRLRETYPESAKIFLDMSTEEDQHRRSLIDLYALKFGQHIPLIRRADVRGFTPRRPVWQLKTLRIDTLRQAARTMEIESGRFYRQAASCSVTWPPSRKAMNAAPTRCTKNICPAARRRRRTIPRDAVSCCASSSPAWSG
jgi:rubrerythrin